ncbi:alkene reductase [Kutzneria sp. NPDC052558]|uniref:alkene reductase n=1 Tax=Kutzneria sp. NPDC052558 TaxID=3364121 RepID=UPI0037C71284
MPTAFDSVQLGSRRLGNRIAMAPMSRSRATGPQALPNPSAALYYRQRASAGFIVTEGIQPSPAARGYPATPGLHLAEQVAAWHEVTDAVHEAGGTIYAQLMHAGRIGHPSLLPAGAPPVAPSPIAADAKVFTPAGLRSCVLPRELTEDGIVRTIADFAVAATNAVAAGFDGVEIHGANGFLIHQFLSDNANTRTDSWADGVRFAVAVAGAVAASIGSRRVGFQISPGNPHNDIVEAHTHRVYPALVSELDGLDLAYLHVTEGPDRTLTSRLRSRWSSVFVLNPHTPDGRTGPEHLALIEDGSADLVSFGKLFLANPDLPRRLAGGGPYTEPDPSTFYGGGDRGYVDYPALPD